MEDANPNIELPSAEVPHEQEAPEKSAVQKRIDELTAEKYAYAKQVEQLTGTVSEMVRKQSEVSAPKAADPLAGLPEGVDPGVAAWFLKQSQAMALQTQAQSEKLFWQMQHQLDQNATNQKHANMPTEVRENAAKLLTGLRQRYHDANLDDAIKIAFADYTMKQMANGQVNQYNNMNRTLSQQGAGLGVPGGQPQTNLVPPSQLPNWDQLDVRTQNKLIDDYEKKGGNLI